MHYCISKHACVCAKVFLHTLPSRASEAQRARAFAGLDMGSRPHDRTKHCREGRKRLREQLQQLGCDPRSAHHGGAYDGTLAAVAAVVAAAAVAALVQHRSRKDQCDDTASTHCALSTALQ
jgi:hypothetical protein